MAEAAQGAYAKLFVKSGSGSQTHDASSEVYEFVSEDMQATRQVLDTGGIRGTRSMPKQRTRKGVKSVQGTIVMHPSPADLDKWLPRICGTAESSDTFALGNTFNPFSIFIDRVTERFEYTDCKVTRADFRSQPNGFVEMTLSIIGGEEITGVSAPASEPSLSTADNAQPFVFHDSSGNCQLPSGTSRDIFDVAISIDNVMDARFVNASTVTSITAQDRIVTVSVTTPFDASNSALHIQSDEVGASFINFTNGNTNLRFDFVSLKGPDQTPVVGGKNEIVLRNDYMARSSADNDEVTIICDSTA